MYYKICTKEKINMKDLLNLFDNNTTVTYKELLDAGYTKYQIKKLCDQVILEKLDRGVYGLIKAT